MTENDFDLLLNVVDSRVKTHIISTYKGVDETLYASWRTQTKKFYLEPFNWCHWPEYIKLK